MLSMLGPLITFVCPGFDSPGLTVAGPNVSVLFQKHVCGFLRRSLSMFIQSWVSVTGTEHVYSDLKHCGAGFGAVRAEQGDDSG